MKGALVFLGVFAIVLIVTLSSPTIPPGRMIYDAIGGADIEYPILGIPITTLVPAVFNGVIYGVIVWLIYSVAAGATRREQKEPAIQPTVSVPVQDEKKPVETPEEDSDVSDSVRAVNIEKIEGIGPVYAKKLMDLEIQTTDNLLEAGSTEKGRGNLAERSGISAKLILRWVNLADLFRVQGIGEEYSDLLEAAGVDTVVELARRNPKNLHAALQKVNEEKKLVRRLPTLQDVINWVEQAKTLPRKIEY